MSNRHKHADMIIAKAENMDLVVCTNHDTAGWRAISDREFTPSHSGNKYFLCLPQHKETCLHWLNGGEVEVYCGEWEKMRELNSYLWGVHHDFMCADEEIRIKPRKEKRWIMYNHKTKESFDCGKTQTPAIGFQNIEIEVEV